MVKFAAADALPKGVFRRSFSRVRSPGWERMPRTPCLSGGTVVVSDPLDKKLERSELRALSKLLKFKKTSVIAVHPEGLGSPRNRPICCCQAVNVVVTG